MFFKYFSRQIYFSRTLQDSPVYLSTFQACANPVHILVYSILLITFANSLDPDQTQQNVGPDLCPTVCHSDGILEIIF